MVFNKAIGWNMTQKKKDIGTFLLSFIVWLCLLLFSNYLDANKSSQSCWREDIKTFCRRGSENLHLVVSISFYNIKMGFKILKITHNLEMHWSIYLSDVNISTKIVTLYQMFDIMT